MHQAPVYRLFLVHLLVGNAMALRRAEAPAPAPVAGPAGAPGGGGQLANGTKVMVGGNAHTVFDIPQLRPTLQPDRFENFQTVESPLEKQYAMYGPTLPPPRDCVRTPGISMCECKEMIAACHEEAYKCDMGLKGLSREAPKVIRDNYQSKFAHPLLNTLALHSSLRKQPATLPQGEKRASEKCRQCFVQAAHDLPHNDESQASMLLQAGDFRQPHHHWRSAPEGPLTVQPEEFGWRIYDEGPDWDAVLRGVCTPEEMQGLEECLSYFWSCDANRMRIQNWMANTKKETDYIDANPGTRPGVYEG